MTNKPTKRRPARKRSTTAKRSPAEAMSIWDDGNGGRTVAPTSARAHRAAVLGDGVAALHIDDEDAHAELVALNRRAWRIHRKDGTVTVLVAYRGPAFAIAGASVQTTGVADVGGTGVERDPGELPKMRWYA